MENSITIKWEVSIDSGSETIPLEYLECNSIEEWNNLTPEEQYERAEIALNDLPERVCLIPNIPNL